MVHVDSDRVSRVFWAFGFGSNSSGSASTDARRASDRAASYRRLRRNKQLVCRIREGQQTLNNIRPLLVEALIEST